MKKLLLVLFLLADMILIAAAGTFLYFYVQGKPVPLLAQTPLKSFIQTPRVSPAVTSATPLLPTTSAPSSPALAVPGVVPAVVAPSMPAGYRNIRFLYKNTKAREVFIRADFTGWKGNLMKKDATGAWIYDAQLPPGEYAYCYAVDSKIIPDPASKRFKKIGQTKVSAIIVTPAPSK